MKEGVRQGYRIYPKLFTERLEEVYKNLDYEDIRIEIDVKHHNNLRFADDKVLLNE